MRGARLAREPDHINDPAPLALYHVADDCLRADERALDHDGEHFAPLLEPSLTAVSYDARAIGAEAARLLLAAMDYPDCERREVRIPVQLVRRRSCGCAQDPALDLEELLR